MKTAVMYGAGNIGRGFIGTLFSASGYRTVFVDVSEAVISELNRRNTYPVRILSGEGYEDIWVKQVSALHAGDVCAVAEAIADADIIATAVGVNVLKQIVPNLAAGFRLRRSLGRGPLNLLICENLMDANQFLREAFRAELTEAEFSWFEENVGLVETSIGRMVPVQTEELKDGEPLRVCVEPYGFLPVDKAAFKGEIPEINRMIPCEPFDFYVKRKLYVHNMGHAVCAYLGGLSGWDYVSQAIDDSEICHLVRGAMLESARALAARYGTSLSELLIHVDDLLFRFTNPALKDTCRRVGGDPVRKLSAKDRLIGAATLCLEQGVSPACIAVGAAAALFRLCDETEGAVQSEEAGAALLSRVSGLSDGSELFRLILDNYSLLIRGADLGELRRRAEALRARKNGAVI